MQGWQNRFGRPSDRQTNVCCMVLERPADVISEVINPESFLPITGRKKHFSFGEAKYSGGVMCLYRL